MKVKVLRNFIDRHNKALCVAGTEIEVSKERYEELNSTSHGLLVEYAPKTNKPIKNSNKK